MAVISALDDEFRVQYVEPVVDRLHVTIGPPGCGKTTFLGSEATAAAKRYGSAYVLIASLTRSAAAEVVKRKLPLGKDRVGTLHSHAYRALGCPKLVDGKVLADWNSYAGSSNAISGLDTDVEEFSEEAPPVRQGGDKILAQYHALRAAMIPRSEWPEAASKFASQWEEWKSANDLLDFEDLIEHARQDLVHAPGRPSHIFLDEAQDHSRSELALALSWAREAQGITVVGDPDQALYTWRGAAPDALSRAVRREQITVLSQSYRVSRAVHRWACAWIERMPGRLPIEYYPRDADGFVEPSLMQSLRSTESLIASVMDHVDRGKTVMVLATCGYMLAPLVQAMKEAGVPFHNPYRTKHGGWNPLRGANRLLSYLRPDVETWGKDARPWTWAEFWNWLQLVDAKKLIRGVKSDVESMAVDEVSKNAPIGATFAEAAESVAACFQDGVEFWRDGDSARLVELSLESKKAGLEYPSKLAARFGAQKLREEPKAIVGTVHSVKGGEADVVYVFPDLSPTAIQARAMGDLQSLYRLFYVGFTRARESLFLGQPSVGRVLGDWYRKPPNP